MTELKMITKISLIVYGVICLIDGIMLVFFLDEFITSMTGWNNPLAPRQFGGTLLGITIFTFLAVILKKDWEQIEFGFYILYYLVAMNIVAEGGITLMSLSTATPAMINQVIFDLILMSIVLILGIISWIKQKQ